MGKRTRRLAFYCELCNKVISSNICTIHGIDFVTIKKVSKSEIIAQNTFDDQDPDEERINGMLQLNQRNKNESGDHETRMAKSQNIPSQDESQALRPLSPDNQAKAESSEEKYLKDVDKENQYYEYSEGVQDIDAEDPEALIQNTSTNSASKIPQNSKKGNKGILIAVLITLLLNVIGIAYFANLRSLTPTTLYSEGETYFKEGHHLKAQKTYNQFIEKYPTDPLIVVVKERLRQLKGLLGVANNSLPSIKQQHEIKDLMIKAHIAFQKKQYVGPGKDNVNAYIVNILKKDPKYQPAIEMQKKIIEYYQKEADAAIKKHDYNAAINNYREILAIKPNDAQILSKMRSIFALKDLLSNQ